MTSKIAVAGGNGFIGSAILRALPLAGAEAISLVRRSDRPARIFERYWSNVEEVTAVLDNESVECIVFAAGRASVGASLDDPRGDFLSSVDLTSRLLEAVRLAENPPHVLMLSSAAVYGQPKLLPVHESAEVSPISPYGHHKVMTERLARAYHDAFGISITIVRVFSVIGADQRKLLPFELWRQCTPARNRIELRGTGRESRDFLHVDDLGSAVTSLALSEKEPSRLRVFNAASGIETSTGELARYLRDSFAPHASITFRGQRSGSDPERWCADVSRLRDALPDWSPRPLGRALSDSVKGWASPRP